LRVAAVIVAAGSGSRIGGERPKQFCILDDRPLLCFTLSKFQASAVIDEIVVVTSEEWQTFVEKDVVQTFAFSKVSHIVVGGKERQDSVLAGLNAVDKKSDLVAIHDAARPFVAVDRIEAVVAAAAEHGAAILAVPPRDTIKTDVDGFVGETLDRNYLWSVQTPQVFDYKMIISAHADAQRNGIYRTDDAALVELTGKPVKVVEGDPENIKITVAMDLQLALQLLERE
jgi:2-C-methyl-D-erythritol 4-phosphate cytidylyltransferase